MSPLPPPNAVRFTGAPGHVESYFVRANHPARPLAVWLKATILSPLEGPPVAESWFIFFDGEAQRTVAKRQTQPWVQARFPRGTATRVSAANLALDVAPHGGARGTVPTEAGEVRFELSWRPEPSPIAEPLSIFPYRFLLTGPFPKSKLLTPLPALRVSGRLELQGETVVLDGWTGMQGHNWGREHAFEYAWGQCLFPEADAMVEGFTGRVRVAGRTSPRLSALVVRRGARTWRFDTLFDAWRQEASVTAELWTLRLRSGDGEAELAMDAAGRPMVCLGYWNPDGALSYCFNSKLAKVRLTVRPIDGAAFSLESPHGGALEFLRREADPRFPHVV
jgi:hypothetical protein